MDSMMKWKKFNKKIYIAKKYILLVDKENKKLKCVKKTETLVKIVYLTF